MFGFLSALYWLSLTIWVGGMVVFSFLLTPAIFQNFPKERAGEVVGVLFPRYFALGHVASVLALASYLGLRHLAGSLPWGDLARVILLVLMLAGAGAGGLVVGPKARQVKAQMHQGGSDEAQEALRREFGKLHGISMALNLGVILCGLALVIVSGLHPIESGRAAARAGGVLDRLGL